MKFSNMKKPGPFYKRYILSAVFCFYIFSAMTANEITRNEISINSNWQFVKGEQSGLPENSTGLNWEIVNIPHTWNKEDVMDDVPGYYRGVGWYRKKLKIDNIGSNKNLYLYFEGVNQTAEVFINGVPAGDHIGGYTGFCIPITPFLTLSNKLNSEIIEVLVKVDNSFNKDIPPLSADFTFYGGIYRNVNLISTNSIHFSLNNKASSGVFITTPKVTETSADINIKAQITNNSSTSLEVIITSLILTNNGKLVAEQNTKVRLDRNSQSWISQNISSIKNPLLWSPENPNLYKVVTQIKDKKTSLIIDEVINPLGFRFFKFDAEKGFFLNGKPMKLLGVNRHQDFQSYGNAIPDEINILDIKLMKEMGVNFLRIAHYPQDKQILELCDRLGILTSVEIPIVNQITESEAFSANCIEMQTEMIRQNFNHPSVIIWAYMNEVLLRLPYKTDTPEFEKYLSNVTELAQKIEDLTRNEDPYRYTMIPNHGNFDIYQKANLTNIPMIVGWNLYQGWYGGNLDGFAIFLDFHRKHLPKKPLIVTEYGGGADPRLRSLDPVRFDFTVDYNNLLHYIYLTEMLKRPFVSGATVWNFADFNSESRVDAVPHINNKGLLGWDRKPKDTYYLYQSYLLKEPFIKIASTGWEIRSGIADKSGGNFCTQSINLFSNMDSVIMMANSQEVKITESYGNWLKYDIPFLMGKNSIEAYAYKNGKAYKDFLEIDFDLIPFDLNEITNNFIQINISAGDNRFLTDEEKKMTWLPDKEYSKGSYGHLGGEYYKMKNSSRQLYGSDIKIFGTEYVPIFQTQLSGLNEYRFDVPSGLYEIVLHFAELELKEEKESLIYNLDSQNSDSEWNYREFSVSINDSPVIKKLDNKNDLIPGRAYSFKKSIFIKDNEGIRILFKPSAGLSILNAVQVSKIL
jgi:beta-galactosidase